ncbi:LOW QUALITY PROTEIN: fat body protein 2 [Drosophila busckii]|uniref:LOW QUALITY PROTEIN: fat body protein 2 n=1 Tax=Drosophila busckii TaxID=30019 RepID=UPI0014330297|nr:LOW QUALITY PROTEIN: fat body protein 2 [Drosophila busckii]
MYDWTTKNVVYVGGFSGIGFQLVKLLVQQKHLNKISIMHRIENAEIMKKLQFENPNVKVMFVPDNIMEKASIQSAITKMGQLMGYVDVLINGQDILLDKDVETIIGVNLTGMIHFTMTAMPYMDKTEMGKVGIVVNLSSVYGLEPAPIFAAYAAAKHGVLGFTRSMADSHIFQRTGVIFTAMYPGLTNTEIMMNLRDNVTWHQSNQLIGAIDRAKWQMPEEAAVQIINAIENMKNGSMWIIDKGNLKEVVPQAHWQI